ncbi:UBP-type zinc finger domain-containing protein [Kitasatospora sp. LaBMicrA B282]|uniref:UBP-type zinc finger domain-containing protein n=1 Tax=Kitasatospora sp. LaBMicrA B282 TaxID=3420949 RepID=UPI003D12AEC3
MIDRSPADRSPATDEAAGCQECAADGSAWVHLRRCLTCGHVGCCDSSRGRHASAHHRATGHPVVASHQPGEEWGWCYPDRTFLDFSRLLRS